MKDRETRGSAGNDITSDQELEAALLAGFKREPAPEDFALRVEASIEARIAAEIAAEIAATIAARSGAAQSGAAPFSSARSMAGWRLHRPAARQQLATAAALLLAFTVPLGVRLHQQARNEQGEAAAQQVMLALRITGTQLRSIEGRTSLGNAGILPGGATR